MLAGGWVGSQAARAHAETASPPGGGRTGEESTIRAVMASYGDALNAGSTDAALALYADDGVFMPPYSVSAIGKEAVRRAYDAVFHELKFDVKFTIAELVVIAPNWAYVRTNSAGNTDHASTGKTTAEANQSSSSSGRAPTAHGASPATAFRRRMPPAASLAPAARRIEP